MIYLLLLPIKIYWFLTPLHNRNRCIYYTSCSKYVYQTAKVNGLLEGVRALFERIKTCTPDHQVVYNTNENSISIKLSGGKILNQKDISTEIVNSYLNRSVEDFKFSLQISPAATLKS